MTDKKPAQDYPAQSQRFIDMAHEVEADGDEREFNRVFGAISAPKPTRKSPAEDEKR